MRGFISCVNHAGQPALFECRECRMHACRECVKHTWTPSGFIDECPRCHVAMPPIHGVAERLAQQASAATPGAAAYLARLPEMLAFPANRSVLIMLIGLVMINGPLYWAVENNFHGYLALVGIGIVKALEASVYFRFVSQTAFGVKEITAPDVTDLADDLLGPLLRYIVAGAPILIAIIWYGLAAFDNVFSGLVIIGLSPARILDYSGPAMLMLAGLALWPLLTVIAAVSNSVLAVLNPAVWVSSLRTLGSTYVVAVLAFYAALGFEYFALVPVLYKLQMEHSILILTSAVSLLLLYLSMALRARLLGGLCEPYFRDLDG